MIMPWDITSEDVKFVFKQNNIEKSKEEIEKIYHSIDKGRIIVASLDGADCVDQVELATQEIENILIERGDIRKKIKLHICKEGKYD